MRAVCVHRGPAGMSLPTAWVQALRHHKFIIISISLQSLFLVQICGWKCQTPPFPLGRQCRSQGQLGPLLSPATPRSRGTATPPTEAAPEVPARSAAPVASFEVCYRGVSLWRPHSDLELASRVPVPCLMGTQLIHGGLPWLSSPQSDCHQSGSATEKRW